MGLAILVFREAPAVVVAINTDAVNNRPIVHHFVLQRLACDRIRRQGWQIFWRQLSKRLRPLVVLAMVKLQGKADEHAVAIAVASDDAIQKGVVRGSEQQDEKVPKSMKRALFQGLHFLVQRWLFRPSP